MNKKKKKKRKVKDLAPEFWQKYGPMIGRGLVIYEMLVGISRQGNRLINRHMLKNLKEGSEKIEEAIDCLSAVLIELQPKM